MRTLISALIGGFLFVGVSNAAVVINIPTALQGDFIASTTAQWNATITQGSFAGNKTITIISKKVVTQPPPGECSVTISDLREMAKSNFDECMSYGVGNGMDYERYANIQQINGLQAQDPAGETCAQSYNVIVSTINQRWSYVYDSKGNIVP